jgi:hypothetical protein
MLHLFGTDTFEFIVCRILCHFSRKSNDTSCSGQLAETAAALEKQEPIK